MPATLTINSARDRQTAKDWLDRAPSGSRVTFERPNRTLDQNKKLWAILTAISRAQPRGLQHVPEVWKCLIMKACGHEVQFLMGLDGEPFPAGFRSSKLNKDQMSELIEFALSFAAQEGITLSEDLA